MPEPGDAQFVRQAFAEIREATQELSDVLASPKISETSDEDIRQNLREATKLQSILEEKKARLYEKVSPFERMLGLREQYERKKNLLKEAGVLIPLSNGEEGIITIAGEEVPFPSLREVSARLKAVNVREQGEAKPFLERKIDQNFQDIQITPFGMPIAVFDEHGKLDANGYGLANIYARLLVKTFDEGRLCYDDGTPIPPDQFDRDNPLFIADEFKVKDETGPTPAYHSADVAGTLRYRLTAFDKNHVEGEIKPDILKKDPRCAYRIGLVERSGTIPRKDPTRSAVGGRMPLDTSGTSIPEYRKPGKTEPCPTEYFAAFHGTDEKNTVYRGERAQMTEEALCEAIEELVATGRVKFDYQGNSSINYCMGAVFANGRVPDFRWNRGFRRASLDWGVSVRRVGRCGVRPVAGEE